MSQFKLKSNQAALILGVSPEGEVNIEAAFPKSTDKVGGFAAAICAAIGQKLVGDENFQKEVMAELQNEDRG